MTVSVYSSAEICGRPGAADGDIIVEASSKQGSLVGASHRPINSVARLATPTACSGTSAGRHLSRDDSILAARRMQVNGK